MTDYKIIDELVKTINLEADELHATSKLENEILRQNLTNIEAKSVIDKIELYLGKNQMLIHLVEKSINDNEIEFAKSLINELVDTEDYAFYCKYVGQRFLLKHYARQGDVDSFMRLLKDCKPGKRPMTDIQESKALLVETYSKINGFKDGLKLCNNKTFGNKFSMDAVKWMAHLISLEQIETILKDHIIITATEPNAKAILYVLHFSNQQAPVAISPDEFQLVVNEISLIDKKIRWGDGRLCDGLFCNLATSTHDLNLITECKRKIIDPFYKRELNYHIKNIKGV